MQFPAVVLVKLELAEQAAGRNASPPANLKRLTNRFIRGLPGMAESQLRFLLSRNKNRIAITCMLTDIALSADCRLLAGYDALREIFHPFNTFLPRRQE